MQESKNCELLFEYLRSILYDTKIETLIWMNHTASWVRDFSSLKMRSEK